MTPAESLPLGDLVDFVGGGTPSRGNPAYWEGNIPWASIKDIKGHSLDQTAEHISRGGLRESASNLIAAGTVIMATRVGLGKAAINSVPVAINQDLKALLPKSDNLIPRYLLFFLMANAGVIEGAGSGATVKGVTLEYLRKIRVPVPSVCEQERIVSILDSADELRHLREQAGRRTADLIHALFHEMFGDPDTNPKGWNIHLLGNLVAEFRYGTSTKSGPQGYPTLRIPNVVGEKIDLADLKLVPVSGTEFSKWSLQEGDVLFVRTNGNPYFVGRTAVFTSDAVEGSNFPSDQFIFASYLIRARVNPDLLNPFFLQQFLRTGEGRRILRKSSKTSAGQYNINIEGLGTIPVALPPILLQRAFAERVAGIRAMEASQAESRRRLDDLFQSLLHRAFRGEL